MKGAHALSTQTDRFGNAFAPGLPYARGAVIRSTEDDGRKLQRAGRVIQRRLRERGAEAVFNFSGLERTLPLVRSLAGYAPERVPTLVATTRQVGEALAEVFGPRLHQTPVTAQLRAEDILELAMERAGLRTPPIVPIEATAALAMLLLEDYGAITVHFAGMPPGTSSLLVKFVPPETLERFGGAEALAKAVDGSLAKLAGLLATPGAIRELLLGEGAP